MSTHFFLLQDTKCYAAKLLIKQICTRVWFNRTSDASWCCAGSQLHTAPTGLNPEIKRIGRD